SRQEQRRLAAVRPDLQDGAEGQRLTRRLVQREPLGRGHEPGGALGRVEQVRWHHRAAPGWRTARVGTASYPCAQVTLARCWSTRLRVRASTPALPESSSPKASPTRTSVILIASTKARRSCGVFSMLSDRPSSVVNRAAARASLSSTGSNRWLSTT